MSFEDSINMNRSFLCLTGFLERVVLGYLQKWNISSLVPAYVVSCVLHLLHELNYFTEELSRQTKANLTLEWDAYFVP